MERWKINLYTVWFSQIFMLMSFSFGMPFLPFYIQELGVVDPDKVKLYSAILTIAPGVSMAVMSPIWGMAADKWGKKLMLLRAMGFAAVIIAAMGFVTDVNQLIVLRFIQGIFTGTVVASTALVATSVPSNRLSFAIGFLSSSTFIGTSAGPVIGGFLADLLGYRVSFYIGGVLALIDFLLVLLLVKEEKIVPKPVRPDEAREGKGLRSILLLFSSLMITLLSVIFLLRFVRSVFSPYLPLFIQERITGIWSPTKATGIVNGVTGLMTALAGLTLCRLGDRHSKFLVIKAMFILGIAASIPLIIADNLILFTLFYGLFFFFLGGMEPIVMSMTSEITPPERRGVLFGIQGLVSNIAWVLSPVLSGFISIRFSIHSVLYLLPVFLVPGLVSIMFFDRKKGNPQAAAASASEGSCLPGQTDAFKDQL